MPGSFTSSTYLPLPRMKRASSLRLTLWPIPPISTAISLRLPFRRLAHRFCRMVNRLHDVHVAAPAAEIPRNGFADFHLGRLRTRAAADVGPGHSEVLAEEVHEQRARLHLDVVGRAVDADVDLEGPLTSARGGCGLNGHLTSLPSRG